MISKTWISWCIGKESNIKNIFLCFTVNELSPYDTTIAFKQKWVTKCWTLTTIKQMEIKGIHNYAIDLNNWSNKKTNTMSNV
jgi:hypothetical protein